MAGKRGYIREFDGMRGLSIALVMLFHIWRYTGDSLLGQSISAVSRFGWAGVDVFFVLSGFLITGILLDTKDSPRYWRNFYIRRSLRIFPLYYAVMTVLLLGGLALNLSGIDVQDKSLQVLDRAWINYLYVTNFVKAFWGSDFVPLDIAWSLAVEEQFYLVFPFVVRYAKRKMLWLILGSAVLLAPPLRYFTFASSAAFDVPAYVGPYVLPYCRMDSLALGGLAMLGLRVYPEVISKWAPRLYIPLGVSALMILFNSERGDLWFAVLGYSAVAMGSTALMLNVLVTQESWLGRVFRTPLLVYFGQISYGLYLLHLFARVAVDYLVVRGQTPEINASLLLATGRLMLVVAVAVAVATLSYYAFEKPLLRLKDRYAPNQVTQSKAS